MTPPLPPPPPTGYLAPKRQIVQSFKQTIHYPLPMAANDVPAWKQVLRDCGLPETVLVLDFETYYDSEYNPKDMSTMEYIADKRFEILGLASLTVSESPLEYLDRGKWFEGETETESHLWYLQLLYGQNLEGAVVSNHNSSFDCRILATKYNIWPKYVIDTIGLSRAWHARRKNGLKHLCEAHGIPPKLDIDSEGWTNRRRYYMKKVGRAHKGLPHYMTVIPTERPTMTSEQRTQMGTYAVNDALRQWELFTILLPKLSNPAMELRLMQDTLELSTKPTFGFDFEEAKRIEIGCELEIEKAIQPTGLTREEISGDKAFEATLHDALLAAGDFPLGYFKPCKVTSAHPGGTMFALAKDDDARKVLSKHSDPTVRNLIAARGALDSWPLHISRVRRMGKIAKACDGKLPVPLNFHGAHTGRDSGAEKINLQNLVKRGHDLTIAIRGTIIGYGDDVLVIVDLAAIEARVLAWLADEIALVVKFANNEEIYCGFATTVLGWTVRKPVPEDRWIEKGCIPALERRHERARNKIGKIGILGCGYGMGSRDQADKNEPNYMFAEAGLDAAMADKIVNVYRSEHRNITKFWSDIERAFKYTAKFKRSNTCGRWLRFDSYPDCDVVITLPNGRELKYHKVRVTTSEKGRDQISIYNDIQHKWDYTWGGGLTENVVQAISRDIMMEAAARVNDRGFHVAHRVHDELICPVAPDRADECLAVAIEELRRIPAWGLGLPLNAEGKIAKRYGNH